MTRTDDLDELRLERALGLFMARHLGRAAAPDMAMFTDLFRLVADHELVVLGEVAAVFRALATVEGTLLRFAPGFQLVEESRRFARAEMAAALTPSSVSQTLTDEISALLPVLRRLPRPVDRITGPLEQGRLARTCGSSPTSKTGGSPLTWCIGCCGPFSAPQPGSWQWS